MCSRAECVYEWSASMVEGVAAQELRVNRTGRQSEKLHRFHHAQLTMLLQTLQLCCPNHPGDYVGAVFFFFFFCFG